MRTTAVALAGLSVLLAACSGTPEAEGPAEPSPSQSEVETAPAAATPTPTHPAPSPPSPVPSATVVDVQCIEDWHLDAAELEVEWETIETLLADDFHQGAGALIGMFVVSVLEATGNREDACAELAAPLLTATEPFQDVDLADWQMDFESLAPDIEATRRALVDLLVATANLPVPDGKVFALEDMGLVMLQDNTRTVVFGQEGLRTGEEVRAAFATGGIDLTGQVIAAPVLAANLASDLYIRQVDFLWEASSGERYRPVLVVDEDERLILPRTSLEQPSSLLVFFDVPPGDEDGELFATIDGILWANLTTPSRDNTQEITDDWRLAED